MTYQEWMNKVNEILHTYKRHLVRNKLSYKAYRRGHTPEQYVSTLKGVK